MPEGTKKGNGSGTGGFFGSGTLAGKSLRDLKLFHLQSADVAQMRKAAKPGAKIPAGIRLPPQLPPICSSQHHPGC